MVWYVNGILLLCIRAYNLIRMHHIIFNEKIYSGSLPTVIICGSMFDNILCTTQWFDIVIRLWWHVKPCMHACSKVIIFLSVFTNKTSKHECMLFAYLLLKLIAVQGPNAGNLSRKCTVLGVPLKWESYFWISCFVNFGSFE